ncbi:MAG: aminotransferase class IV [Chloroflexota bacterium]
MPEEILVYKITRSETEQLHFDLPDFDTITTALPEGLYTTFRTYAGRSRVVGLHSHLARLYLPARVRGITPTVRRQDDFREILYDLLKRRDDDIQEARVRLILDTSVDAGTIYVLLAAMQALPAEVYENGVRLDISKARRELPALKRTEFISKSSTERKRVGGGIFELLLINRGRILEGVTSNFFYILDGVLCTAGRGILIGVTRQTVLTLAKREGIEICYKALALNGLSAVEEAFITSSSRGVVPVVQIGEQQIANGQVGETTRRLMNLYQREVLSLAEEIIDEPKSL